MQGGDGEKRIHGRHRRSVALDFRGERAPPIRDCGHRQEEHAPRSAQGVLSQAKFPVERAGCSPADLRYPFEFPRGSGRFISLLHPFHDKRFRFDSYQFGNVIGIEKITSHRLMSRPVSLSRSNSSSRPTSGESRKNCRRLFLGPEACREGELCFSRHAWA